MQFTTSDLPSEGKLGVKVTLNLNPFTYKQIIEYNRDVATTYIQKVLKDMRWLELDIGEKLFNELSFFDFDMLCFIKKSISVVKKGIDNITFEYNCNECGKRSFISVPFQNIHYNDLNPIAEKLVNIKLGNNTYKFQIPTMGKVKKVMGTFSAYHEDIDRKILLPICCMDFDANPNLMKKIVEEATVEDIQTLEYLNRIIDGSAKSVEVVCNHCRKEQSVSIDMLMTDFFRLIEINNRFDQSKVIIS